MQQRVILDARLPLTDRMGGQGTGGARAKFLPPARSRRNDDDEAKAGPSISEKIKARQAGGAEEWEAFKVRLTEVIAVQWLDYWGLFQ